MDHFVFESLRIVANGADGRQDPATALGISAHGAMTFLDYDPDVPDHWELRIDLDEVPELAPAADGQGYDLYLWTRPRLADYFTEVWVHRFSIREMGVATTHGETLVRIIGLGSGRSLHLERELPVPFPAKGAPGWLRELEGVRL
ncbi:hypothetical protein AB0O47_39695 [Streptomyces noursei]|uniref:hypothetical protein n=1 Tax=Streptomyces noursei TaxID=1971 RepID=UPI00344D1863